MGQSHLALPHCSHEVLHITGLYTLSFDPTHPGCTVCIAIGLDRLSLGQAHCYGALFHVVCHSALSYACFVFFMSLCGSDSQGGPWLVVVVVATEVLCGF
jgi:hypothetical protein